MRMILEREDFKTARPLVMLGGGLLVESLDIRNDYHNNLICRLATGHERYSGHLKLHSYM